MNKAGHPVNSWHLRWHEFDRICQWVFPKTSRESEISRFENLENQFFDSKIKLLPGLVSNIDLCTELQDFYSPFQTCSKLPEFSGGNSLESPSRKSEVEPGSDHAKPIFGSISTIHLSFPASIGQLHCHRRWKEFRPVTKNILKIWCEAYEAKFAW